MASFVRSLLNASIIAARAKEVCAFPLAPGALRLLSSAS
jgi:hypothetical protein